jgi:hypothetical protein
VKEVNMPSPRKAPPSNPAENEMSSRKKSATGPKQSAVKAQGAKEMQVAKRSTKAKPKS